MNVRVAATYLAIAVVAAGCGATASVAPATTSTSATAVPVASSPSSAPAAAPTADIIDGWPTVAQSRDRLTAAGYQLFQDTTGDGQNRWTGADPRTSPIEILGDDAQPAKLSVEFDWRTADLADLEAMLALMAPADRVTIVDLVQESLSQAADGQFSDGSTATLQHGRVDVDAFDDGTVFILLYPDASAG